MQEKRGNSDQNDQRQGSGGRQFLLNVKEDLSKEIHLKWERMEKKSEKEDFHGGPVVKNLPSNAGHEGSMPGRGTKIPPVVGQLSLSHSY